MPQKLSSTQVGEMLTNQLGIDLLALEKYEDENKKEPSFSQKNGSLNETKSNDSLPNAEYAVNGKFYESVQINESTRGWDEPIPLESTTSAPPFPIHCLPEVLRDYVLAIAEDTQTPIDMSAVASIGTSSACLQGKFLVQGKIGYIVPLNNYIAEVAKPAERKSSICAIFEEPLKAYEKQQNETFALEIAQSVNIRQVLEKELEALKNAAVKVKGKGNGEKETSQTIYYAEIEAKQAEILNHQEIKPLRLVCGSDISPEALTSLLADNNGRMSMFSAEGGIFDILKGMYSQTANIDTFLKAHCGDSIRVDRKGRTSEIIEKPSLTTLLFIQPDVLREVVGNETFRGRGLVARFLYSYPKSTVGNRRYKTKPVPQDIEKKFRQLCEDMLEIKNKEPQLLTLAVEAETLSEQFYYELEPRLGKDGDLEYMADWAGKLHGSVLRIAGLLHVVDGVSKNGKDFAHIPFESVFAITRETMSSAIEIGRYFLEHAQICYGFMGADKNIENAQFILQQLEKKKPVGELRPYDIWRICKGKRFQKVDDITASLKLLEDYGYIKSISCVGLYDKGRPVGDRYILNPKHFTQENQPSSKLYSEQSSVTELPSHV